VFSRCQSQNASPFRSPDELLTNALQRRLNHFFVARVDTFSRTSDETTHRIRRHDPTYADFASTKNERRFHLGRKCRNRFGSSAAPRIAGR